MNPRNLVKTAIFNDFLKDLKNSTFFWKGSGYSVICDVISGHWWGVRTNVVRQRVYRSILYLLKGLINCRNENEERIGSTL